MFRVAYIESQVIVPIEIRVNTIDLGGDGALLRHEHRIASSLCLEIDQAVRIQTGVALGVRAWPVAERRCKIAIARVVAVVRVPADVCEDNEGGAIDAVDSVADFEDAVVRAVRVYRQGSVVFEAYAVAERLGVERDDR